jgi:hypothetical protein
MTAGRHQFALSGSTSASEAELARRDTSSTARHGHLLASTLTTAGPQKLPRTGGFRSQTEGGLK